MLRRGLLALRHEGYSGIFPRSTPQLKLGRQRRKPYSSRPRPKSAPDSVCRYPHQFVRAELISYHDDVEQQSAIFDNSQTNKEDREWQSQ
jgi:hypothetical protein